MNLIRPALAGLLFSLLTSCGGPSLKVENPPSNIIDNLSEIEGDWVSISDPEYKFRILHSEILYPFGGANPLALDGSVLTEIVDTGDDPEESKTDVAYRLAYAAKDSLAWYEQGRIRKFRKATKSEKAGFFDPQMHRFLGFRERSSFMLMADIDFREMLKSKLGNDYNHIISNMGGGHGDVTVEGDKYLTVSSFVNRGTDVFETLIVVDMANSNVYAATTNGENKIAHIVADDENNLPLPISNFVNLYQ